MGPKLREKVLSQYPDWHQQPLRLTTREIEQPHLVLSEFFDVYNLPTFRACLKQWLDDAIRGIEVEAAEHVATYDDVEKLAEAAWVMNERMEKEKAEEKVEDVDKMEEEDDDLEDEGEDETEDNDSEASEDVGSGEREESYKVAQIAEAIVGNPYDVILEFFGDGDILDCRENLDEFFSAAIKESVGREKYPPQYLFTFEGLERLVEAAYCIQLQAFEDRYNEDDPYAIFREVIEALPSPELFPERLRPQEWHQPRWTFRSFFEVQSISEWKKILHYFVQCCFLNEKLTEQLDDYSEVYKICDNLYRLQEAAYLIKVMELDKKSL